MDALIYGGTALVGPDLTPVADAAIAVVDGRIVHVGPRDEVAAPAGAHEYDAAGAVVAPGFVDAHVHIAFHPPSLVLRGGVTTVRDLGWPPEKIHALARRSRAPDFDGPTVLAAGPMLTCDGGYPTRARWAPPGTGRVVDGVGDAAGAVERTAAEGACVIKVALNPEAGPTLDRATLRAIVEAAHARGLKVTGHVGGLAELDKALASGIDELAHMLMGNDRIADETIERMVSSHVTVVPTLACRFGTGRRIAIDNLARFRAAGGAVVYGTDLGNSGVRPGIDGREVSGMTSAGFSPIDIVRSATIAAARWLRLDHTATIAPGRDADLVALDARALDDARALTRVQAVWRNGGIVTGRGRRRSRR